MHLIGNDSKYTIITDLHLCWHLALWVKISVDEIFKYFFLIFSRKKVLSLHANCLLGGNLHEVLKPIFWEKYDYIIYLSSAEFARRMVKVNIHEKHKLLFFLLIFTYLWWFIASKLLGFDSFFILMVNILKLWVWNLYFKMRTMTNSLRDATETLNSKIFISKRKTMTTLKEVTNKEK